MSRQTKIPRRKNSTRVRIRGKWWRVVYGRAPKYKVVGMCDYASRTLYITRRGEPYSTAIHEALHAALPDLDEDAILATELAVVDTLKAVARLL